MNPSAPTAAITVAIATRERPASLARCLQALQAGQRLPAQIVVVDQSRDDRTRTCVAGEQAAGTPVCYVPHAGSGLGTAQNLAFARATCPVVAVLDDDCVAHEGWLTTLEQLFAGPDAPDVVAGRVLPLGPARAGRYPVATRPATQRRVFGPTALPWEVGSGNNFAVRRAWLERIGGNDARLGPGARGRGGADMDLFYRLLRAGARTHYEPAALVYHEQVSRAGRLGRRVPYGYGMGACAALWRRAGDHRAGVVLGQWLVLRGRRLAAGLRHGDALRVSEELLVLAGTVGGILYGLRASAASAPSSDVASASPFLAE